MAAGLPPSLKAIGHYIKIANEHTSRDPSVYYWALFYSVQAGMKIDKKSPDSVQYLTGLLGTLEEVKKSLAGEESVTNEMVASAHIEQYALKLFTYADTQDRASNFNKNVVKAFYTAGHLFDILTVFGELDEQLEANQKYAKWKAAYIHNCLKNGETPVPGPMNQDGEPTGIDGLNLNVPGGEQAPGAAPSHSVPPANSYQPEPSQPAPAAAAPAAAYHQPAPVAQGPTGAFTAEEIQKAQKCCKYANSALEYDDIPTAIDNLQQALLLLTSK